MVNTAFFRDTTSFTTWVLTGIWGTNFKVIPPTTDSGVLSGIRSNGLDPKCDSAPVEFVPAVEALLAEPELDLPEGDSRYQAVTFNDASIGGRLRRHCLNFNIASATTVLRR